MNSWVKDGCPYAADADGNLTVGFIATPKAKEDEVAKEVKAESKPKSTRAKTKKK